MEEIFKLFLSYVGFFIAGVLGVGLPTIRTLQVIDGKYMAIVPVSIACSMNMYILTFLVAKGDLVFMALNALGSAVSVSYLAYKKRR
jgi:hypothetical protein